jgi:NO-binding membrane sensor protein with MHYT domain
MTIVAASALIAVVASIVALWLAFNLRGRWQMLGSALVMGLAVCGMHYTGMQAATFIPNGSQVEQFGLSGANLGMGIFAVTSVLLVAVLSTSLIRQRQRNLVQI